ERLERRVNVTSAVRRIERACVLDRIVDALASVLDVKHLVPQVPKPEEIHQRAPRDAAKGIARDDAGEEDSQGRIGWMGRKGRKAKALPPIPPVLPLPPVTVWPPE